MTISATGTTSNQTEKWLSSLKGGDQFKKFDRYGRMGVDALASATPADTGETANSWGYRVGKESGRYFIEWFNTHNDGGPPVAILIQYGHGTGTGGYVAGRDFINPALRPVFDKIANEVWRQVTSG